ALFVGDALTTRHVLTGATGPQPAPFTDDPAAAAAVLTRLEDIEADWVLPGHGPPWTGGVPALLAAYRAAADAAGVAGTGWARGRHSTPGVASPATPGPGRCAGRPLGLPPPGEAGHLPREREGPGLVGAPRVLGEGIPGQGEGAGPGATADGAELAASAAGGQRLRVAQPGEQRCRPVDVDQRTLADVAGRQRQEAAGLDVAGVGDEHETPPGVDVQRRAAHPLVGGGQAESAPPFGQPPVPLAQSQEGLV